MHAFMPGLADELSIVELGDTLALSGYPEAGESKWHGHSAEHITRGSIRRAAIILQAVDAQDHWLTIAMEREGEDWTIDDFAAFEGKAPRGGSDEAAEPIDPGDVELVRIQ